MQQKIQKMMDTTTKNNKGWLTYNELINQLRGHYEQTY
ncbi:hypothetical protein BLA3211_06113 [Burkholderia aenigmatica]|jgi:hypothetical protein|uniref:Uncharacterized protein n=1 Tax=Burkholderia aenigmatica TaxID=2015348 RepID=A0A6J5JHJ4_9BURK|nr:hypothetical protein BLA3211_06113 [Burkholderia aenigmatica]